MKLIVFAGFLCAVNAQCPVLTPTPIPDDVNNLDITNIRVLAALGDSITTGFGINDGVLQIREESFSIGGGSSATTMASIIRAQNPNVTGLSVGFNSGFNVAVSGAVVRNMPDQAETLVSRFRSSSAIDYVNDWKMVTIWIGGNNICAYCNGNVQHTPEFYKETLGTALKTLSEVPRVVVNLITQFNFSSMYDATATVPACFVNRLACGCVMNTNSADRVVVDELCQSYNVVMRELTTEFNGLKNDFGVILQTVAIDSAIPSRDFLSSLDCFHPNRLAHQVIGINGFNELFKAPADKSREIDFFNPRIECATDANKHIFIG